MAFCHALAACSNSLMCAKHMTGTQFSNNNNSTRLKSTDTMKWSLDQHQTLLSTGCPSARHRYFLTAKPQSFRVTCHHASRSLQYEFERKYNEKLNQVRRELNIIREDSPIEELVMIDAIQHLGISYQFEDAISEVLQRHYMKFSLGNRDAQDGDSTLFEVSLRFRLLRQEGYAVSTDLFNKFKDNEGKFNQSLCDDIKGLMSLNAASYLSMEGEDHTLDEAKDFSSQILTTWLDNNRGHQEALVVKNTLRYTYHNNLVRFTWKDFLANLQSMSYPWRHVLQELSIMQFNILQTIHQRELQQIFKWWRELGLNKEMKLIRDQPLKWYMWSMAMMEDPNMSELRIDLTKAISLIYVVDDIFDIYGTFDELTLFTKAVGLWDFTIVESLPVYMRACFKALDDTTTEIAHKVKTDHGWDPIHSLRKTWATLCNAFLVEAKWFALRSLPKAEEYLKNGVISSGVHVVLIHMFFMLGHDFTNEGVDLVFIIDKGFIASIATILRLWDDLGSAKDENQDRKDGSYIECYMEENEGVSDKIARELVHEMIRDTWKRLNKESLCSNSFSSAFIKGSLNLARMVPLMYSYDDNSLPCLEQHMKSLLREPFSLKKAQGEA